MAAAANLEMVQVELLPEGNDDYPTFTLGFDGREYTVKRGARVWVPFWAAVNAFGDPRSGPVVVPIKDSQSGETLGWIPDRRSEVGRLRLYYGLHADNYQRFDDISIPNVAVYDVNNEPVTMVIHDPEGNSVTQATQTVDDRRQLLEVLDKQQEQIDQLRRELGIESEIAKEDELPADDLSPALFGGTGSNQ